jgi:predicted esterase
MRLLSKLSLGFLILTLLAACSSGPAAPTLIPVQPSAGQEAIVGVSESAAIVMAGKWRAQKIDAFKDEIASPEFDDSSWTEFDAPGTWSSQGFGDLEGQPVIVAYRTKVDVPSSWKGKKVGISAWFNPFNGRVFVNGTAVDPTRKPFAAYADVSDLLQYGKSNTITVTTLYEGYAEFGQGGSPRLGLVDQIAVSAVQREEIKVADFDATFIHPVQAGSYPAVVFNATGSHGMAEREAWYDLGEELARQGIVSLALALPQQKAESIQAAIDYLRQSGMVDSQKIYLFGVDQAAPVMLDAAIANPQIAGLIALSPPQLKNADKLGNRNLLVMVSEKDQSGRLLVWAKESAAAVAGAQVVTLPGDGHGTFVFSTLWSSVRTALLDFIQ